MATFRIFDDQENYSSTGGTKENMHPVQNKRAVLGVISNTNNKPSTRSQKTNLKDINPGNFSTKSINDENACAQNINKKSIPPIPVAQFEAFSVYEDVSKENLSPAKSTAQDVARAPFQELENIRHESPMSTSVSDICPMSVDKSIIIKEPAEQPAVGRSAKDRFFEVAEYQKDIYQYLRGAELRHRPKSGYMKKQPDITHSMRSILVDWLVEVCEEYRLQTETLCLAVSYIDRFLSYMSVVRAKLQLVGTAAIFIAAKYEEIYPPDVSEFVYITDDTYSKKQVVRMEHLILKVLAFDLSIPTQVAFINLYCIGNGLGDIAQCLALYVSELSMLEADPYLQYLPSHLAAAAVALARHTLGMDAWNDKLQDSTHYAMEELRGCFDLLHKTHLGATSLPQQAIQEKYKNKYYKQVSLIESRPIEDSQYLIRTTCQE